MFNTGRSKDDEDPYDFDIGGSSKSRGVDYYERPSSGKKNGIFGREKDFGKSSLKDKSQSSLNLSLSAYESYSSQNTLQKANAMLNKYSGGAKQNKSLSDLKSKYIYDNAYSFSGLSSSKKTTKKTSSFYDNNVDDDIGYNSDEIDAVLNDDENIESLNSPSSSKISFVSNSSKSSKSSKSSFLSREDRLTKNKSNKYKSKKNPKSPVLNLITTNVAENNSQDTNQEYFNYLLDQTKSKSNISDAEATYDAKLKKLYGYQENDRHSNEEQDNKSKNSPHNNHKHKSEGRHVSPDSSYASSLSLHDTRPTSKQTEESFVGDDEVQEFYSPRTFTAEDIIDEEDIEDDESEESIKATNRNITPDKKNEIESPKNKFLTIADLSSIIADDAVLLKGGGNFDGERKQRLQTISSSKEETFLSEEEDNYTEENYDAEDFEEVENSINSQNSLPYGDDSFENNTQLEETKDEEGTEMKEGEEVDIPLSLSKEIIESNNQIYDESGRLNDETKHNNRIMLTSNTKKTLIQNQNQKVKEISTQIVGNHVAVQADLLAPSLFSASELSGLEAKLYRKNHDNSGSCADFDIPVGLSSLSKGEYIIQAGKFQSSDGLHTSLHVNDNNNKENNIHIGTEKGTETGTTKTNSLKMNMDGFPIESKDVFASSAFWPPSSPPTKNPTPSTYLLAAEFFQSCNTNSSSFKKVSKGKNSDGSKCSSVSSDGNIHQGVNYNADERIMNRYDSNISRHPNPYHYNTMHYPANVWPGFPPPPHFNMMFPSPLLSIFGLNSSPAIYSQPMSDISTTSEIMTRANIPSISQDNVVLNEESKVPETNTTELSVEQTKSDDRQSINNKETPVSPKKAKLKEELSFLKSEQLALKRSKEELKLMVGVLMDFEFSQPIQKEKYPQSEKHEVQHETTPNFGGIVSGKGSSHPREYIQELRSHYLKKLNINADSNNNKISEISSQNEFENMGVESNTIHKLQSTTSSLNSSEKKDITKDSYFVSSQLANNNYISSIIRKEMNSFRQEVAHLRFNHEWRMNR